VTSPAIGQPNTPNPMSRFARSLPWLVVCVWLLGALFAFWFFELRVPGSFMCRGSSGLI
jgi:hypothetical protein